MGNIDIFIDDVLVYTITWEKHIKILKEFLRRLRLAGLTTRPTKCVVGYNDL